MIRKIIISAVFFGFLFSSADLKAIRLRDQAVTFANFNFINQVASSMSHTYFATTEGIIRYNKFERRWELPLTGSDGMTNEEIKRVWVDTFDDMLYAQTAFSLYEYDLTFDRWYPIDELPEINNDSRHLSRDEPLLPPFQFNFVGGGSLVDPFARSFPISDILNDNSGRLWIGTWGYGPATAPSTSALVELIPYGLLQNRVNAIYLDDSLVWVAGAIGNSPRTGISVYNPEANSFFYVESGVSSFFPAGDINCLDGNGAFVYIGTEYGVYILDRERLSVTDRIDRRRGLIDDNVISLKCKGDSLFVGTEAGLTMISGNGDSTKYIRPQYFFDRVIFDIELVGDYLWLGTSIGAYRYSLKTDRLQKFEDPELIITGEIYSIEPYENSLWFASNEGVVRLDTETGATESFREFTRALQSRALAVNDRICAIASDKGMTFIFYNREKPFSREFTIDDGLPSNYVYELVLDGDFLWVGTDKGLTRFWWSNPNRVD
ncbi:MAG: hypothetical protein JXA92_05660 [candidate division Zixibacteria bacterium]|nr:hypothetical protein [candidate division Zixibacteria bacterium]